MSLLPMSLVALV